MWLLLSAITWSGSFHHKSIPKVELTFINDMKVHIGAYPQAAVLLRFARLPHTALTPIPSKELFL